MSTSGDAAEQVVRMSLEGVEMVAKISGQGAMEIAKLLLAEMKMPHRMKGRASLMTMLRQGKEIKVFEIDDQSLKKFCTEAKKYGVMYHVLKDKSRGDGKCDIMVRKEDVPKVNRIFERFGLGVDHKAVIRKAVAREKGGRTDVPEEQRPKKTPEDRFIEELFMKPGQREKAENDNPTTAKTGKSHPSAPSSDTPVIRKSSKTLSREEQRPSVKKQLRQLDKQRKQKAKEKPEMPKPVKTKKKGTRSHGRA